MMRSVHYFILIVYPSLLVEEANTALCTAIQSADDLSSNLLEQYYVHVDLNAQRLSFLVSVILQLLIKTDMGKSGHCLLIDQDNGRPQ